jgi:uncharacterized protein (TIGR02118 family)
MVKLSVMYHGRPQDPAAFDDYYWEKHLPTVVAWPKVRRILVAKGTPGDDFYQVCDIFFESHADLEAALASPERKVSAEDIKRFPTFDGQIKRQAFEVRDFPMS